MNNYGSELAPELSEVYREIERTHALHLDVSELILSSNGYMPHEWVRMALPDEFLKR